MGILVVGLIIKIIYSLLLLITTSFSIVYAGTHPMLSIPSCKCVIRIRGIGILKLPVESEVV